MASKPKPPQAIVTTAAQTPRRCPACWQTVPTRTSESGGVTRLTCACGWTERYLIVSRVPDHEPPLKGGESLAFKKRTRVGPCR